jgi:TolB protein
MRALLPLLLALAVSAQAAEQTIAYSNETIHARALDGGKPARLAQGSWPDISPDGTKVAYNTESAKTMERHIAVADIAADKSTIFRGIPSDNNHSPTWSPDGRKIAFYIYANNDWHIGLVNADGTGFRYLKKANPGHRTLWGAAWAVDGKSLFCQDLDDLLRIDLEGNILKKWKLADLFPNHGLNSGAHLAPSPDGKTLLIDVDMAADVERPGWDGPPPAIWQLDLATDKVTQVTKTDLFAWHPVWINDHEILCNHMPGGVKTIAVYRLDLKTQKSKLVVKNARDATVSTR